MSLSSSLPEDLYAESIQFLYERINYERLSSGTSRYPFRLKRTCELVSRLGLDDYLYYASAPDQFANQERKPPIPLVHIAGTKGKGSTATMVGAILTASGLRTGVYTSPHLNDLEERFRVDGQPCLPNDLVALIDRVRSVVLDMESDERGAISFFELTTALALLHFHVKSCDAIVLEVGLGGRLDSTNVCLPTVTAITSIGLDHQRVLGNTLAEIAFEKAGIIKPGIPVVSGVRSGEAAEVIGTRANEESCRLYQLGRDFEVQCQPDPVWGSRIDYHGEKEPLRHSITANLALDGAHQAHNAALAISIVELLRAQGTPANQESIETGLSAVRCPGRIERFQLNDDITLILDTAHNDDSIEALCSCLRQRQQLYENGLAVVFGTSNDKNAGSMLSALREVTETIVLTQYTSNPRFTSSTHLLQIAEKHSFATVQVTDDPVDACRQAKQLVHPGGTIVVCGSFFLAAETRPWVQSQQIDSCTSTQKTTQSNAQES